MKSLFAGITILFLLCGYSYAGTQTAASCSQADVQTAISAASRGDTVIIPSGSCTWSTSYQQSSYIYYAVRTTQAIKIQGNGVDFTNITANLGTPSGTYTGYFAILYVPSSPSSDANTDFEVTGITFDDAHGSSIHAGAIGIFNENATFINKVRIHNNKFLNAYGGEAISTDYTATLLFVGSINGVVYSNSFYGLPYIKLTGYIDDYGGRQTWANSTYTPNKSTALSADGVYFEDNTFTKNVAGVSEHQVFSSQHGVRYIGRYNTFTTTTGGLDIFNMHSIQVGGTPSSPSYLNYATMGGEFYGNYVNNTVGATFLANNGGGRALLFYNLVNNGSQTNTKYILSDPRSDTYTAHADLTACNSVFNYPSTQACSSDGERQRVNKSYYYNNRNASNGELLYMLALSYSSYDSWSGNMFVENVHYFQDNASCTASSCTAGVGCGSSTPTGSCSSGTGYGVGYWKTSQSCSTVPSGSYGANPTTPISGTLYRCVGGNWVEYYTPYTYPHPLRGGGDTSAPSITATSPTGQVACSGATGDVASGVDATDNVAVTGCKMCADGVGGCSSATDYASMGISLVNTTGNSWRVTRSETCNSDVKYNAKCTDGTNTSANAVVSFHMEVNNDTIKPTVSSATLGPNGRTVTVVFDEAVKVGAGGSGGFKITNGSAKDYTLTYTSGSLSTTVLFQTSECVPSTDTFANGFKYTQPGNGIEDIAGNDLDSITTGIAVTNTSTQACGAATSLWYPDDPTYEVLTDTPSNLGVQFTSTVAGTLTDICFYKDSALTGTHVGVVWSASILCGGAGDEKSRQTFTGETASGWQCQKLDTPVSIIADCPYRVSVHIPTTSYVRTGSYFASQFSENNLVVPSSGGYYTDSTSVAYPSSSTITNFWIDFVMEYQGASGPWQVTTSKTGAGCTSITGSSIVNDKDTAEVTITVNNGWAVSMAASTCPAGSGTLTGNTYVYTTGAVESNCTVVATCTEVKVPVWVAP